MREPVFGGPVYQLMAAQQGTEHAAVQAASSIVTTPSCDLEKTGPPRPLHRTRRKNTHPSKSAMLLRAIHHRKRLLTVRTSDWRAAGKISGVDHHIAPLSETTVLVQSEPLHGCKVSDIDHNLKTFLGLQPPKKPYRKGPLSPPQAD
jgi:hypothetical protein